MRLRKIKLFDPVYRAIQFWPRFYELFTLLFSLGQWEKWQNTVFEDLSGKKILEIGVGPGKLLLKMAQKGYSVTGIEISRDMAYEAKKKLKAAGFDVDILSQSIYHLPFKDGTFDCIVMTFVLAEISDFGKAVKEMKRILKKGGKIIAVEASMPRKENLIAKMLFKFISCQTNLRLKRDNECYFKEFGFDVQRRDFGPFNIVNKIVATKQ